MIKENVGFIGAGKMAESLINGIIKSKTVGKESITVADVNSGRLEYITEKYNVSTAKNNAKLVEKCSIIIFAVKPNNMGEVLDDIKSVVDGKKLIISIAAGIKEEFIRQRLGWETQVQIARVMPNTPALVLQGACGIYFNEHCSKTSKEYTQKIFDAVGISFVLEKESLMDAVTALSGSGPAYVFFFLEALSDAGVAVGLSREMSQQLALQTVLGSAQMVKETKMHPTLLKEMVTSPGGTTIEALTVLERSGVKGSIIDAVKKAYEKAKELSKG